MENITAYIDPQTYFPEKDIFQNECFKIIQREVTSEK